MRAGRPESGLRYPWRGPLSGLLGALVVQSRGVTGAMEIWLERRRTRRRLTHLSDHMLKDIGVSHDEVARETQKPFWRK